MEEKRRIRKNELKKEIKECESIITRSTETIGRLRSSNMGVNYVTNQISILKEKIESKTKLVEELNNKINDIKNGLLDDEIQKEYDDNRERSKSIYLKYMENIPYDKRLGKIWFNGKTIDWADANIHILNHGLHYASCVFEGERVYEGEIFKLEDHTERLFYSAKRMGISVPY